MSSRYSGYPASIHFGLDNLVHLRQLESYGFNAGNSKSYLTPGGSLSRLHVGLASATPMHRFGTRDLETILDNIGSVSTGIISNSDGGGASAIWRWQQRNCEGGFATGASNILTSTALGFIKPVSISASENDKQGALMNMEYYSISTDGLTAPDAKATGSLATAPTPAFVSRYFFGPTYYNAAQIVAIDGFSCNFGINLDTNLFSSVFPTCYVQTSNTPSISLQGTQLALDAALSKFINNIAGGWTQYLRRGVDKNTRVSDATASHISIGISAGEWCIDEESWSGTEDGQISVDIQAVNANITVGIDVAIP